jgi:hypothetical protein
MDSLPIFADIITWLPRSRSVRVPSFVFGCVRLTPPRSSRYPSLVHIAVSGSGVYVILCIDGATMRSRSPGAQILVWRWNNGSILLNNTRVVFACLISQIIVSIRTYAISRKESWVKWTITVLFCMPLVFFTKRPFGFYDSTELCFLSCVNGPGIHGQRVSAQG